MGLKENREQLRYELNGQFVSVNMLIDALAEAENMEPSEVAAALLVVFEQPDEVKRPALGSIDTMRIVFGQHEFFDPDECQKEVLTESLCTIAKGYEDEYSDRFGWLRDDLFPFLQSHGFDVPLNLPAWKPQGSLANTDNRGNDDQSDDHDRYEWMDHPLFPEELSIAITAWNAAVVNSEQSGMRPGEFIRKWLGTNNPGLKAEAIKRIATVANWEKVGGRAKKNGQGF